ncbi:MAG: hypothetical protein IT385_20455 [Deltaproteobacteria bacterium]|nr:hypothetical protein [Deltaproteobacteria bacterium]
MSSPSRPPGRSGGRSFKKPLSHVGRPGAMRFAGQARWREPLERAMRPPEGFDERALTHGFHAWPARLHPFTARALIALAPAGAIADPFMGGGTTPLEALLAGRQAIGNDLNPIALEVAWTRTRRGAPKLVGRAKALAREAEALTEAPIDPAFVQAVGAWFDPVALHEVWALRSVVLGELHRRGDDVGRILRAALSSIVVKVSRQVSDSVPKIDREARGRSPRGQVFRWFVGRVAELEDQLAALARAVPRGAPEPRLALGDAREAPADLPAIGAVISSPPYPGVYDYLHHHLVRCAVLDLPATAAARDEIGARRVHERTGREQADRRYVEDLGRVLAAWSPTLAPDGFVALVVGDGQLGAEVIPVLPMVAAAASQAGLAVVASLSDARPTFGPGKKRGPPKDEHLVLLQGKAASRSASGPTTT